jgi:hypothetical protein
MNPTFRLLPLASIVAFSLALLATPTSTFAFGGPPGGPGSNGSYFSNEGTFSAVVRGENLTGTLQFSTTAGAGPINSTTTNGTSSSSGTGGVGSTGVATIYYEGDTYQGNSQGAYNAQASSLTVNFQADAEGQGERVIKVKEGVSGQQALPTYGPDGNITGYVSVDVTSYLDTKEIYYYDALYLNGFADCKTSNAFPNQKFKGSGQAEFQQLIFTGDTPFLDAVPLPISITGVRLSDTAVSFNSSEVRPPSVNEFSVLIQ